MEIKISLMRKQSKGMHYMKSNTYTLKNASSFSVCFVSPYAEPNYSFIQTFFSKSYQKMLDYFEL